MSDSRHEAFAAALQELFKRYPLPEYKYAGVQRKRESDREHALEFARLNGDLFLVGLFAFMVPTAEIESVHTLIYR